MQSFGLPALKKPASAGAGRELPSAAAIPIAACNTRFGGPLSALALVQVACLNEHSEGSCQRVFKPWGERTDFSGEPLKSCLDDEPELLLHIPCAPRPVVAR
jgi:PITH domain